VVRVKPDFKYVCEALPVGSYIVVYDLFACPAELPERKRGDFYSCSGFANL